MSQPPPTTPPPSTSPPPLQSVVVDERPSINNSGPLNIIASTSEKMAEETQDHQTVSDLDIHLAKVLKIFEEADRKKRGESGIPVPDKNEGRNIIRFDIVDGIPIPIFSEIDSTLPSNGKRETVSFPDINFLRHVTIKPIPKKKD